MGIITYCAVTGVAALVTSTGIGVPLLGAIGFTSAGPVAGSFAAGAQAYVGNVVAGSFFAAAQAATMSPFTP
ncbi:hypothetical protein K492DRAFT_178262 [Lichtheimia hyalospora FSU 10163]|nr:hypothetical protein K492DRAFT_178262 [Lichtheimia hyalospora FSU 10163]